MHNYYRYDIGVRLKNIVVMAIDFFKISTGATCD